jgi:hypothetical protein
VVRHNTNKDGDAGDARSPAKSAANWLFVPYFGLSEATPVMPFKSLGDAIKIGIVRV